jgi:hypothetical protein
VATAVPVPARQARPVPARPVQADAAPAGRVFQEPVREPERARTATAARVRAVPVRAVPVQAR